jgi:hypothetical protein
MAVIGGEELRELWFVEFDTRVFKRSPGNGVLDLAGEEAKAGVHVWAVTGDEAVGIVRGDMDKPGNKTPWLGLVGVQRVGLLEVKILNQPVYRQAVQPALLALSEMNAGED